MTSALIRCLTHDVGDELNMVSDEPTDHAIELVVSAGCVILSARATRPSAQEGRGDTVKSCGSELG